MKLKAFLFILTLGTLLVACQKEVPQPQEAPYEVNVNPNNPHILRAKKEDGTVVNYYGLKDEFGKTKQIQLVSLLQPGESNPDLLYFNDENQLARMQGADGSSYKFDWLSATTFRLTATSADRSHQVSIPIDLNDFQLQAPSNNDRPEETQFAPRQGSLSVGTRPIEDQIAETITETRNSEREMTLHLSRCGQPVPVEELLFNPLALEFCSPCELDGILLPQGLTNQYIIPEHGPGIAAEIADICSSISGGLGNVCTAVAPILATPTMVEYICGQLQLLTPPGTFFICEISFRTLGLACIFGGGPVIGAPSILDKLCDLVRELESDFEPSIVKLSIMGESDPSASVELPYNGPFGDVYIDLPEGEALIENLKIAPADPVPGQDYLATANIHCAAGQTVSITVVGTDGYVDSNSFIAEGGTTIFLHVPGAEGGVKDVITVEVEGGPSLVTSIIF